MLRGSMYSVAFLATMWVLGMTASVWSLAMVPVAMLISLAFSAVAIAGTTYMRTWADFEYVPSLMLPMFLFSATFYPLSSYGDWQWVVQLSPLYHGVAVVRGLNQGDLLLAINGTPVASVEQARSLVAHAGKSVALLLQRDGERIFVPVRIG